MKTYSLELRHAAAKRQLNATPGNRSAPLRKRLGSDLEAIAWAQGELTQFARGRLGRDFRYVEAALSELLPLAEIEGDKDMRRLGRWVSNPDGLVWRPAVAREPA